MDDPLKFLTQMRSQVRVLFRPHGFLLCHCEPSSVKQSHVWRISPPEGGPMQSVILVIILSDRLRLRSEYEGFISCF